MFFGYVLPSDTPDGPAMLLYEKICQIGVFD